MGAIFPFLQLPGCLSDCHEFLSILKSGMATTSAYSFGTLGCISSDPQTYVCSGSSRGHEHNLLLHWEGLCSLLRSTHLRGVGREADSEHWGKKSWSTSSFSSPMLPVCQPCLLGWYTFFDLPFLVNRYNWLTVEALPVIHCVLCQVQLQLCLDLPHPLYYLAQGVIYHTLQNSSGLPTAHRATCPAEAGAAEVHQQDKT